MPTKKYNKSKVATNLVTSTRVSTNKAAKICQQLSHDGIDIPTPSQAAIYKSIYKEASKLKEEMIETLQMEQWSLHFDGKCIEYKEYQVVVLKNERTEVKLGALHLKDGKAKTITEGIAKLVDEYNLWNAIKMIIADTTSVNTGKCSGVVVCLKRMFSEKGFSQPQFISCQHHVLDRILRLVMDQELGGNTTSPTRVFRFFDENGHFPCINFQQIPNISNARWNSRAILALLAFILMPTTRTSLEKICRFISCDWADYWFTDQMYNENDFKNLSERLKPYRKALNSLDNHWKQEPSILSLPQSNQCAERAVKVMLELYSACKNKDKLPLRFILSNK